ncbi:MAG: penicillin-insensitive murein endopeptidase [Hyphomicrobiaceae bacterium]
MRRANLACLLVLFSATAASAQDSTANSQPSLATTPAVVAGSRAGAMGRYAMPHILPPVEKVAKATDTAAPPLPMPRPEVPDRVLEELRKKNLKIPAKQLFGHTRLPAAMRPQAVGYYSRGCLAGGAALPINGKAWQVMRLSRNRNWGHPALVALIERLARDVSAKDGWPGLLVGDMSQPRGGPMLTGHASHQMGLDADIWLTPMPARRLTRRERETTSAISMLSADRRHADPKIFTANHQALILRAASYPEVERIFVHPGIKKALCEAKGLDHSNFYKIRPYWGHHYHMHIRMGCPHGSEQCREQAPTHHNDDGCGKEINDWMALIDRSLRPKKPRPPSTKPVKPRKPKPPITLADMPELCTQVIEAPAITVTPAAAAR